MTEWHAHLRSIPYSIIFRYAWHQRVRLVSKIDQIASGMYTGYSVNVYRLIFSATH